MKRKKVLKVIMGSVIALSLFFTITVPTLTVNAMESSLLALMERRYINGDGVRLRKEGRSDSTVLELMYNNEPINFYLDDKGEEPGYYGMSREATRTYGYVHISLTKTSID